ncbi:MAG: bifunctional YncE family protein/alkaline phosphatase family protein [Acidobacteriia bacterium]|nr:bifunctional YncE family protein/alkaline phosphatase family protein [Terriglobia bacterium]
MKLRLALVLLLCVAAVAQTKKPVNLPSSKVLLTPVPGNPQAGVGSLPAAVALSPDGRYLAILDAGFGAWSNHMHQGIAVLDLVTNKISFFPDARLPEKARQTYFLGLAFSGDGSHLYASFGSLTDPLAKRPGSTGNGIAVYRFDHGRVTPQRFIPIPPQPLAAGKTRALAMKGSPPGTAVSFPAGLAVLTSTTGEQLLVACNLSDTVLQLDVATGNIIRTFDLSISPHVPAAYPYAVVANRAGTRAWVSLWNASAVAELDLEKGTVARRIPLREPPLPTQPGSHPTALLLTPDQRLLYVALANADEVAVLSTGDSAPPAFLSTRLHKEYFGAVPDALAQTADGRRLFVANAGSDSVAVFDLAAHNLELLATRNLQLGFIPTEWLPTALAVRGDDLLIVSGKSQGAGPNSPTIDYPTWSNHTYIAALLHGSIARVNIADAEKNLAALTREVEESNLMNGRADSLPFRSGRNPIQHVIYVIKENRTYDQVFGDLGVGDGDRSLTMYGESITPNHHQLARQFGVLDNFYDSGEVSGIGHVWSTAAIVSDYTERIWPLDYRGAERTYDFEGQNLDEYPLLRNLPDVNEPASGYLWGNAARHALTYRHYGEFVSTQWCDGKGEGAPPGEAGTPPPPPETCKRPEIKKGEPLPSNVGNPRGGPSPYPWPIPSIAADIATKPELRDHFDPRYPDFRLEYPDQLRADEFLNEFAQFVGDRQAGKDTLPNLIVLRLPQDHTAAKKPGLCRPAACVADNDLALGRVVDAVSHSPFWDDTAILVLEDDAQNGADHVDAHRSIALVISKYAPRARNTVATAGKSQITNRAETETETETETPFLDHHFYTTVSMIHTLEVLLGLPPMNNNDAHAPIMAPLFSGDGTQPPFTADYRNRDNALIYEANPPNAAGAAASMKLDLSHPDAADPATLNRILWRDAKGNRPMPTPKHTVFPDHPRPAKDDD